MSANPFDQDVPMHDGNGAGVDLSAFDEDFAAAETPAETVAAVRDVTE